MTATEMQSATTQMAVLTAAVWKDLMAMEPSVVSWPISFYFDVCLHMESIFCMLVL